MLPDNALSVTPVPAALSYKIRRRSIPLIDYEQGGVAIGDGTQGLDVQLWVAEYVGGQIVVYPDADHTQRTVVLTLPSVQRVGLAFNTGMHPTIAYEDLSGAHLYYYDAAVLSYVTADFPGIQYTCCTSDEKRPLLFSNSDVLYVYMKGTNLCYRQQRDKYGIEYTLQTGLSAELIAVCMNQKKRVQFRLRPLPTG